jgi:hypothetical protein
MNNINPGRRRRNGSNFSHLHPFSEYAILPSINRLLDRAILLDTRMQAASLPSSAWQISINCSPENTICASHGRQPYTGRAKATPQRSSLSGFSG